MLAQQKLGAPAKIEYMMTWTGIGPACTTDLDKAQRFASEQDAMSHPAFTFMLTFFKPCPVLGDEVARPVEWLDAEMAATHQELIGEDPADGLRVFS